MQERRVLLRSIVSHNAHALLSAVVWCRTHGVGAFRVNSEIIPLSTHPSLGYSFQWIDPDGTIQAVFVQVRLASQAAGIRLSLHPDQFVVPGSARKDVAANSLHELEHQAFLAELIGAEQITLHAGGAEGGKSAALARLRRTLEKCSSSVLSRLCLENDDRIYTPADLFPICQAENLRFVYDVHHHRCNPDGLSIEEATCLAAATWGEREPWFHISSPDGGWRSNNPRHHAPFIHPRDFPKPWFGCRITVDVEAKAKEHAVLRLKRWLHAQRITKNHLSVPTQ